MASPLDELSTQIEELRLDARFVGLANQLRPRLGSLIQWQIQSEALKLVREFISIKSNRPEGVFGPLLIRLLAAFERYLRQLVAGILAQWTSGAVTYDDIPPTLARRNLVLTGRLLSSLDTPRDHLSINVDVLVQNLASCKPGSTGFRLNPDAFCAGITGVSPMNLEKALESVDVTDWWDAVGARGELAKLLGTKGARATGGMARERLKELSRWRNHLAHGGDGDILISDTQLRDAIEFIACFSRALDAIVRSA